MSVSPLGGITPQTSLNGASATNPIFQRPGMKEVFEGLNLKSINHISIYDGSKFASVSDDVFKKIKASFSEISTLNQDDMKHLANMLGFNFDEVTFFEEDGGFYLVQESLAKLSEEDDDLEPDH
ncbi:hypothetical protein DID76_00110 [Candidatus Marinamargulisbacteria bacterium SCGC AG-414-C22]|nr:hypothetical protein DID76_00110 [Candidatus Marinamargulisbacteria bacterium SCGC AG-414-C22]